jgi:hypothetical protein
MFHGTSGRARTGRLALGLALASSGACTLTEITTTEAEDVVVVEALLQHRDGADVVPTPSRISVFLHRTVQGEGGLSEPVDGAEVRVARADGTVIDLFPAARNECVVSTPINGTGSCYLSGPAETQAIEPGERLELTVATSRGEVMEAVSVLPGDFELATTEVGGTCSVEPDRPLEVVWSSAAGAWTYVNEIEIRGLREALPELGDVEIPDPLVLLGLSVSAIDTTIVAPNEFGVFDRFDLDQPLAVALQKGLPAGSRARVSISAVDRNYVNWVRGGGFNPSGQVRIPSVRGDGTGFFGTGLVRTFAMRTEGDFEPCRRFDQGGGEGQPG